MIKGLMVREVECEDGHRLGKGDSVLIAWPDPHCKPMQVEVHHQGHLLSCPASTALYWIGLSISHKELAAAIVDGNCDTPGGLSVEPDGVDLDGVPSWLKIYGLT